MSLTETINFDKEGGGGEKSLLKKALKPWFLSLTIILTATLSFGLGRLSAPSGDGVVKIELDQSLATTEPQNQAKTANVIQALPSSSAPQTTTSAPATTKGGEVVVSKNGSKYHYLHCSGAKQIKEENKIFFPTSSAAEASGYTLAANCKPR